MKIHSIEIEGLWAYRDPQRIDLTGLPLIVGVGENGAGKSAILVHAIVLAFYGRFPTKTTEESINDGSTQGSVSVEFSIGETLYRVNRTFPRSGKATAIVKVQDANQKTTWRPVTENGSREVNAYIAGLLGMDYETASMTWIAEQGQYGKFASSQPTERFKLLAGVFGLNVYAEKAKLAQAKLSAANSKIDGLDGRIAEIEEAMAFAAEAPEVVDGLAGYTDESLETEKGEAQVRVDRVTGTLAELSVGDPQRHVHEAQQALDLVRNERLHLIGMAEDRRTEGNAQKSEAERRHESDVRAADLRHENAVAGAKSRAEHDRLTAESQLTASKAALVQIASAAAALPGLTDERNGHRDDATEARAAAENLAAQLTAATSARASLKTEWDNLKTDILDAEARIAALTHSADGTTEAECFTCQQHLSAKDSLALIASQRRDIADHEARKLVVKQSADTALESITANETARTNLVAQANNQDLAAERAAATVTRAEALIATKPEREQAARNAEMILLTVETNEREQFVVAGEERKAAVRLLDSTLAAAVAATTKIIDAAEGNITKYTVVPSNEIDLDERVAAARIAVAAESSAIEIQRAALEDSRDTARRGLQLVLAEISRRNETASTRRDQKARLESVKADRKVSGADRDLHALLSKAFSPSGIPAMILAGVVEDLNDLINVALERLSRGELSIKISASRELANGNTKNELTVFVETPTGTRAYEGLSGGQKFRVDLAIRTGLSQAIARGTGTPIETFILDEGWGTLDEKGILATVDTVFRLAETTNVITVSHIAAVRDAFPARVEVTMSGLVSSAEVIAA